MKGTLLVFIAAIFSGAIGPVVKLIGGNVDPLAVTFYRVLIAFLFLLALYPFYRDNVFRLNRHQLFDKFIIGLFMAIGFGSWVTAFNYAPVSNVVLLGTTQAIFAAIFGYLFLKEKINLAEIVSFIIAIIGFIVMNPFDSNFKLGSVLSIISSISFGFLIAYMKKRGKTHSYRLLLWSFFFATILLSPFIETKNVISYLPHILFLAIFSTALTFLLLVYGLKYTKVEVSSLILLIVIPLAAILLSTAFLGEKLVPNVAIGGLLLIGAGIVLLEGKALHLA
ncbi:MAG TPA: DMT family transporter [Candidatus Nanoarchaeia archaeon]|nr:DMT family transporter [Candidatus Nanoarchaeia archaeon]